MVFDDAYQVIGFVGGLMFPLSTAAQTYKVLKTRSATDISYAWQLIFALAHLLYLVYSIHFGLWVIYVPQALEIVLLIFMIVAKVYFDNFGPRSKLTRATGKSASTTAILEAERAPDT
ncbi:hypothetical protein CLOM_g10837 [Closterium sp. NIES-68]|nr:hypothetical protein CLOM_g19457 [Closterium sp. NIES-68]GJP51688.1 hypothetical protein CLOM_g10837 [Closterium sp. NIES-68]GJP76097.1 hypothetical protein CLOP_g6478 [Closterium sp. NIES-67]GJP84455.1 hypothetical protein CLOP_g14508 [Closterium sp. NIES-67]